MPPTPTRSRRSSSSCAARCASSSRTRRASGGGRARRVGLRGVPANVIHGFDNVGLEPAYLQVMLGKGRPELMTYADATPASQARAPDAHRSARPRVAAMRSRWVLSRRLAQAQGGRRLVAGQRSFPRRPDLPGMLHLGSGAQPARPRPGARASTRAPALAPPRRARRLDARRRCPSSRRLGSAARPRAARPAYRHPALAGERVRHVGEAVAVVVADDPYRRPTAPRRVAVDVRAAAGGRHAGRRHGAVGAARARRLAGQSCRTSAARARAIVGAACRGRGGRRGAAPLPARRGHADRGARRAGRADARRRAASGLVVHAGAVRRARRHRRRARPAGGPVRVIAPDVGGGFGIKGHVYPEESLVAAVARRLGRPVKWVETRREHFLTAAGDRDQDPPRADRRAARRHDRRARDDVHA